MIGHKGWVYLEHAGLLLKGGSDRVPHRGAVRAAEHERDAVLRRFGTSGLVQAEGDDETDEKHGALFQEGLL